MNMGNDHVFCFVLLVFYLRSSVEIEHQTLLLGDDAPHFLPRFVFLTVLQEAAHDAAACELSCLNLHGGGKTTANKKNQYQSKAVTKRSK